MWFAECNTLAELKAAYREAALKHHPDRGGNTATMQAINEAYAVMFERLKRENNVNAERFKDTGGWDEASSHKWVNLEEVPEDFIAAIEAAIKAPGDVSIDLCGEWLWAWGAGTYGYRSKLKAAGYRWSKTKAKWYWRPAYAWTWSRGDSTYEEIQARHGCYHVAGSNAGCGLARV